VVSSEYRNQSPLSINYSPLTNDFPTEIRMLWHLRDRIVTFDRRPLVMGIVNVTPDSFSDGGQFARADAAIAHGLALAEQGADILDIGGESTRPGATPVDLAEELRRVVPVVSELAKKTTTLLSIDTSKAAVAQACLDVGAQIVNDVTALGGDPNMLDVARRAGAGVILMHMQGTPATMQSAPHYDDVVGDISKYLLQRLQNMTAGGLSLEKIALDPGVGFGKTHEHNLEIVSRLAEFGRLGRPICLGASRKGFIGKISGQAPEERMIGSVVVACHAFARKAAQIIRVHDVAQTYAALRMMEALTNRGAGL
jgi:dihydropteroate synthase